MTDPVTAALEQERNKYFGLPANLVSTARTNLSMADRQIDSFNSRTRSLASPVTNQFTFSGTDSLGGSLAVSPMTTTRNYGGFKINPVSPPTGAYHNTGSPPGMALARDNPARPAVGAVGVEDQRSQFNVSRAMSQTEKEELQGKYGWHIGLNDYQ